MSNEHGPRITNDPELTTSIESKAEILHTIEEDYHRNIRLLNQANLLEIFPEQNALGIRSETGQIFLLPTLENILTLCEKNWSVIEQKRPQGFTKLQLTPLALPIRRLIAIVQQDLVRLAQQQKLFAQSLTWPRLDERDRVNSIDPSLIRRFNSLLQDKEMSYFVSQSQKIVGITKNRSISAGAKNSTPGWNICFIEDMSNIPIIGSLKVKGGRPMLDTGGGIRSMLIALEEPAYKHERGFTVEDALTHILLRVYDTGQIPDTAHYIRGLVCSGNYFPSELSSPCINFINQARLKHWRMGIDLLDRDQHGGFFGTRTAVSLNIDTRAN